MTLEILKKAEIIKNQIIRIDNLIKDLKSIDRGSDYYEIKSCSMNRFYVALSEFKYEKLKEKIKDRIQKDINIFIESQMKFLLKERKLLQDEFDNL